MNYNELDKEQLIAILERNDNFRISQEIGEKYQDFIIDELLKIGIALPIYSSCYYQMNKGESACGIEIKHDSKMVQTGNIYFECKAINKNYTELIDGGIMKNDNAWLYLIGDETQAFIFSKLQLQMLYKKACAKPRECFETLSLRVKKHYENGTITSEGITLPIEIALKKGYVLKHLVFNNDK